MKKKPKAAIIVFIAVSLLAWGLFSTFSDSGPSAKEKQFIMENGVKCVASLIAVERTGTTVNNIHQYAFTFRIKPDSGAGFETTRKKLIDPIYMSGIEVGMDIPAYTVPGNEEETLILWEKAGIGEAF